MFSIKLNLLSVGTNAKTSKGDDENTLTAILYLAPNTISGYNVCPNASPGCIASCLFTAGRGAMTSVQEARTRKTRLFFEDNNLFIKLLCSDLSKFQDYCLKNNITGYVRLNGTSDIRWEDIIVPDHNAYLFDLFKNLRFYDYTKVLDRLNVAKFDNYKILYSRSELDSNETILRQLKLGFNVSIVFEKELPETYLGYEVINGDLNDLRWNDPSGVIVGLKAKGLARRDTSGFVIRQLD